jgi:hypothetical protein
LLLIKKSGSIRSAVYIHGQGVNTAARKDFILDKLVPAVETFEKKPESTCVFPNATFNAKPSQTKLASLLERHFSHLLAFLFLLEVLELL